VSLGKIGLTAVKRKGLTETMCIADFLRDVGVASAKQKLENPIVLVSYYLKYVGITAAEQKIGITPIKAVYHLGEIIVAVTEVAATGQEFKMAKALAFSSLKELIKAVKENYIGLGPEMDDFLKN